MKIISLSDWHIRSTRPIGRVDDYHDAQFRKLHQLKSYAWDLDDDGNDVAVCIAGDLFDSVKVSYKTFNRLLAFFEGFSCPIYVVAGNHDQSFHNADISGTPLKALALAGVIEILDGVRVQGDVAFIGTGWEQVPHPPVQGKFNVLVYHIPVYEIAVPWYHSGKAYTIDEVEQAYPGYDLYLLGDIHIPAVRSSTVISGSLMRSTITQRDYKPRFCIIDTDKQTVDEKFFTVEADVFSTDLLKIEGTSKEFQAQLDDLVAALKERSHKKVDFKTTCFELADPSLKPYLQEVFEHADH